MSKKSVLLPISSILNIISAFGLLVVTPWFLEPSQYAVYGLSSNIGVLCSVLVFEWLRISILRFSGFGEKEIGFEYRSQIVWGYVCGGAFLATAGLLACAFSLTSWVFALGTTVIAICQGAMEGGQALSRARLGIVRFAIGSVAKFVLQFVLVIGAAYAFSSGAAAVIGHGLALLICVLMIYGSATLRALKLLRRPANARSLMAVAAFGVPISISTVLSASVPGAIRILVVSIFPPAPAGGLILALELGQRALGALGTVINVAILQRSIIRAEKGDADGAIAEHVGLVLLVLLPACIAIVVLDPAFRHLVVPPGYLRSFGDIIVVAVFSGFLQSFRTIGVDSVFVITRESRWSFLGAATAFALSIIVTLGLRYLGIDDADSLKAGLLLGSLSGVVGSVLVLGFRRQLVLSGSGLIKLGIALAALCFCLVPIFFGFDDAVVRFLLLALGLIFFYSSCLALDFQGIRGLLREAIR